MKKIIVLFSVLSLVLTSCSNDDGVNYVPEDLVGKWQCQSVEYNGTVTIDVDGEPTEVKVKGNGVNINMGTVFNLNPQSLLTQGSFNLELIISINGEDTVHPASTQQLLVGDSWSQDGRELIIHNNGEEEPYYIEELLPTTMTLTASRREDMIINGQAGTVDFEVVATYRSVDNAGL